MKVYKAREYHDRPLCTIEFEDATSWRIRYPRIQDVDALAELQKAQVARFQARVDALKARAEEARVAAEAGGTEADKAGRDLLASQPDEDPEDVSKAYLHAEVLAAFITPPVSPSEVLKRLGEEYDLDFMYERHEELMQALSGDAAKKRMRGTTR
jgi:hypothetical protein